MFINEERKAAKVLGPIMRPIKSIKSAVLFGIVSVGLSALLTLAVPGTANAAFVFYSDSLAAFDAATTTVLTDFEGIHDPIGFLSQPTFLLNGNTFKERDDANNAIVCDANSCSGNPYNSDLLAVHGSGVLRIDVAAGSTAVGGIFGDIDGPAGSGTIKLFGSGGLLDTQTVTYGDMGLGETQFFYGWTVTNDVITGIEFDIGGTFAGVDNFQSGTVNPVPIPDALPLFVSALAGLGFIAKRKKQAAGIASV